MRPDGGDQIPSRLVAAIGAPDYGAYLARHAERHPDTAPLSERDYVADFIERR